jgi:hypothetical protein
MNSSKNFWALYSVFIVFATLAGFGLFTQLNKTFHWGYVPVWVYRIGFVLSILLYLLTGRSLIIAYWKLLVILVVSLVFKTFVYKNFPSLGFAIPYLYWEYFMFQQKRLLNNGIVHATNSSVE